MNRENSNESVSSKNKIILFDNGYIEYLLVTIITVTVFMIIMSMFIGMGPKTGNTYNSYSLQAEAWLHGRLDLGQDYGHLELAIYDGKYYVSFPPFPSYIMLPFALFFGSETPDYYILLVINLLSAAYLFLLSKEYALSPKQSMLCSLLAVLCSNYVFTMLTPYVWFIAQTLCFALSVMCIYYALKNKLGISLFFWACSVGCRPMQVVYGIVPLIIVYAVNKKNDNTTNIISLFKRRIAAFIPAALVAVSYMTLNYLRFRSIMEFGHNYLPEFTESEYGQFSMMYVKDNLTSLFRGIRFEDSGRMVIDRFNNLSMLIVSPVILFSLIVFLCAIICDIKKNRDDKKYLLNVAVLILLSGVYMFIIVMHKTMGGWHFGNRYSNDIIPWMYFAMLPCLSRHKGLLKYAVPFAVWGLVLNAVGTVFVYNG